MLGNDKAVSRSTWLFNSNRQYCQSKLQYAWAVLQWHRASRFGYISDRKSPGIDKKKRKASRNALDQTKKATG
ncbi:hypothetical protein [Methylobacter sp. S3L5C]|uniref:hypothetical protein n=1 Tax=Methylobacter sp. S3L5C TaxID=2839024 RepID=UPI001FAD7B3E|nr:hypothetical protein [Methylobacter sp. S3L5C]UOA07971.1 hypothetical protein KKZ03_17250 [Methylobacter sp. S3L5C]